MHAEVDSLRDNETFQEATGEELRGVPVRKILPMKMVVGTKRDPIKKVEKKKARCVVCGNFQDKSPAEELYTANADITFVRAALAAGMRRKFSLKVIDVNNGLPQRHLARPTRNGLCQTAAGPHRVRSGGAGHGMEGP